MLLRIYSGVTSLSSALLQSGMLYWALLVILLLVILSCHLVFLSVRLSYLFIRSSACLSLNLSASPLTADGLCAAIHVSLCVHFSVSPFASHHIS